MIIIIVIVIVISAVIFCIFVPISDHSAPQSSGNPDGKELFEWTIKQKNQS